MYSTTLNSNGKRGRGGSSGGSGSPQPNKGQKVSRSRRVVRPRLGQNEIYFKDPEWTGSFTQFKGGTKVVAYLTYRAADSYNGSRPQNGECTCVDDLNTASYKGTTWIKGHLLNDNLGGPGVSKNLTAMSSWRNRTFNGDFEQPIKTALIRARQLDESRTLDVWYGVKLVVAVSGWNPGSTTAEKAVRQRMAYAAAWISVTKDSARTITVHNGTPHPSLPDLPNANWFDPGELNPMG